ncbi:MAG TPA: cytochrome c oxidase accessory protein CcoG, partial [Pseudomonadales bacterium]|nr:cytochrome c oxidase accessory protein CcoG [Pseudomonadales bacterium]
RIYCGYTCPQTVWTAIFMWVEQITEGPRHARIRLDQAPWHLEKVVRRGAKHSMWMGWAFLTGLTFVGYFMPIRTLAVDVFTLNVDMVAAAWIVFFTLATYINAGWMREQVCIYMCPYARFQSAMFDKDTLIVSYDPARGEPRGARKRGTHPDDLGDCIDCELCVQVCPTGIDIRNGLQYQCIDCAHCIDACDDVMRKVGYAPGLIRYTTDHQLEGRPTRLLRPRVIGYAAALSAMVVAFSVALFARNLVLIDVIRDRGELFHADRDAIRNDYTLKIVNKTQQAQTFALTVTAGAGHPAPRLEGPASVDAQPGEVLSVPVTLAVAPNALTQSPFDVRFGACDGAGHCDSERSDFFGPVHE